MSGQLIRDGQIVDDDWQRLDDEAALPASGRCIVTLARWREQDIRPGEALQIGVLIPNTEDVETLSASELASWALIALEFPAHGDGRAYSQARLLRDRLAFDGELRATGDVLRDQLFYMQRCGFNAFELAPGRDPEDALAALREFTVCYQPAADRVRRRRAAAA